MSFPTKQPGWFGACIVASLAISGMLAVSPATAESTATDATSKGISLAEAQRLALQRNWDLLAAAADVDAATAQKIVAAEFPNPTLSLSTSQINVDHHPNSTVEGNGLWERGYDTVFSINQLFEIGGKRHKRRTSAQAGFEAAKAQFLDAKRKLDLAVSKAYFAAEQGEENGRVLLRSSETLAEEAKLADVRARAGEISGADRNQIEVAAERFDADAHTALATGAQNRVALEILLAVAVPRGGIVLSDRLDSICETSSTGDSINCRRRADVIAAEAALRKAESDLRLQKSMRAPDPTVQAQYEHEAPDFPNSVGFGVSFPLPIWNRNRGNVMAAEAARDQARLALEKTEAQAAADVATAELTLNEARLRWHRYRGTIQPKSDAIRQTVAYAYRKGGASYLDLLAAERNDNDVRIAEIQAASDVANALAAMRAATEQVELFQGKR
jgi:cobalt-zinc-cadmium efflux system outer membrane protein